MSDSERPREKQATWKTLLIIGIVSAVVWLFTAGGDNQIDAAMNAIAGLIALIGLLGGLILLITSRKN